MADSPERTDPSSTGGPAAPADEAEEIRTLFHRLWSKASTGDTDYVKAEWKQLAALLARRGIST